MFVGFTTEGSGKGISYLLSPALSKMFTAIVWKKAATQAFFSLSLSINTWSYLASRNKYAITANISTTLKTIFLFQI